MLIKSNVHKSEGYNSSRHVAKMNSNDWDYPKLESEITMSEEQYEESKIVLDGYAKDLGAWEDQKRLYNAIDDERKNSTSIVNDMISAAHERIDTFEAILEKFARYVKITDGDERMAIKFLRDAEEIDEGMVKRLAPGYYDNVPGIAQLDDIEE